MSNILLRRTDREMEAASRRSPGTRLHWLRRRAGVTLGDLARFLQCEVTEISSIERGFSVHPDTPWLYPPDPPMKHYILLPPGQTDFTTAVRCTAAHTGEEASGYLTGATRVDEMIFEVPREECPVCSGPGVAPYNDEPGEGSP